MPPSLREVAKPQVLTEGVKAAKVPSARVGGPLAVNESPAVRRPPAAHTIKTVVQYLLVKNNRFFLCLDGILIREF